VQGRVSIEAVITLLLLGGVGSKRWADKWGNIVHGTVSCAAMIIFLLIGRWGVKRRSDRREALCMEH